MNDVYFKPCFKPSEEVVEILKEVIEHLGITLEPKEPQTDIWYS